MIAPLTLWMVLIDMSGRFSERMLPDVVTKLWDLREAGRTGEEIAVLLGWKKTAVLAHLDEHGGIRPRWGRNLSGRSLSFEERQEIMIWNAQHLSIREMGRRLGRSHSTVSRELRRNVVPRNRYRATTAHRIAFDAARRPRPGKLEAAGLLRDQVKAGLKGKLSPEQISGRLRVDYPDDLLMRVSHETIYRALYSRSRNTLTRGAVSAVRTGRRARKARRKATGRVGRIQNMTLITDRPAIVEDRTVPGAWEGDLIIGKANKSAIGTLVERSTGTVMLLHIPDAKHR
ncbi:IS30 family transposase, partial [Subtercola sp. RTI3]|uniref:IS30 family transposase n=1 Tax=Subtercola sp. RTI3 TaxID=3048639 RepID=UPI002B23722F